MIDDWELLDRFADSRDEAAFQELVGRYLNQVVGSARRALNGAAQGDAEDVVQAVFLLLARNARRIPRRGALAGWLFHTTRFCCANARKMRQRRRTHEREAGMISPTTPGIPDEMRHVLDQGLASLAENERQALLVKFFQDKTAAETGALLGITPAAAEKRLERGLAKLRRFFATYGFVAQGALVPDLLLLEHARSAPAALTGTIKSASFLHPGEIPGGAESIARKTGSMMRFQRYRTVGAAIAAALAATAGAAWLIRSTSSTPAAPAPMPAAITLPATPSVPRIYAEVPIEHVDAPALVREIRASEKWLDTVTSFHVKVEESLTQSPQAIEVRRNTLHHQFPQDVIDEARFPELRSQESGAMEFAFDGQRLYLSREIEGRLHEVDTWDGTMGTQYQQFLSHADQATTGLAEQYTIWSSTQFFHNPFLTLAWPRSEQHAHWWLPGKSQPPGSSAAPEEFTCLGKEPFEGIDCYILGRKKVPQPLERWHVGVKDHLLHKMEIARLGGDPGERATLRDAARKRGVEIADDAALAKWTRSLPAAEIWSMLSAYRSAHYATAPADIVLWMLDYTEIAPNCWFPRRQGYFNLGEHRHDDGSADPDDFIHPWVSARRDMIINDLQINQKLPDALFEVKFKEGVDVRSANHPRKTE
jgi:RNA polymerase sigma factor (sigma-70 family)